MNNHGLPSQMNHRDETPEQGSASKLLEREPESSYVIEWTQVLMREKEPEDSVRIESSLFLFQLQNEIMALPTFSIMEVLRKVEVLVILPNTLRILNYLD